VSEGLDPRSWWYIPESGIHHQPKLTRQGPPGSAFRRRIAAAPPGPHDQSERLTCGNDDRGQPESSCRPGPDGGIRTAALHHLADMVTASRCCPEVPAPQPQPLRTSPDDLAAELNPHKTELNPIRQLRRLAAPEQIKRAFPARTRAHRHGSWQRLRLIELLTGTHPATCPSRGGDPGAAARTTPSSCSPCPGSWPPACAGKPARCSPRPASASPSPGSPRSTGPPASLARPGPRRHPARGPAPAHPRRPARPRHRRPARHQRRPRPADGSPPPSAPATRRDLRTAPGRTGTTRRGTAPRPHQPGIRPAQDRPYHRVQRACHQTASHQRRAPPVGPAPDGDIDPHWLREQYQDRQRSLKDIVAETGTPVEALAAAARKAGIRVRHGIAGRPHPLAALGGPGAFPRTSGASSPTRASSSASAGSSPSPASPASTTQPASSASGTPYSSASSASSRPASAPPSCAPGQRGDSR
jgi:hypothetical protein